SDIAKVSDQELKREVADFFDIREAEVTQAQIDDVRNQYIKDWLEWPVDIGAPYYDRNRNGQWDVDYDEPGIVGSDQIIWYVVNDVDDSTSISLYGSPHIGLELQVTIWVYKYQSSVLGQVIFKRYRLINKSGFQIDSMFVGQWVDPDIGYFGDDFLGCDSLKDFGYCYNGNAVDDEFSEFGLLPPAVGYALLQGPKVPSAGDTALYDFQYIEDYKNLGMTSFWYKATGMSVGDPCFGDYDDGTIMLYYLLNGYYLSSVSFPFMHRSGPNAGQPTKFPVNGDPVTGEGDIDGQGSNFAPGERRFLVSSGPFCMMPGDTQDVVIAVVGADGGTVGDNLTSVAKLQDEVTPIREFFNGLTEYIPPEVLEVSFEQTGYKRFVLGQNYPNPFNNGTAVHFKLFGKMDVKLEVYNIKGEIVKAIFEGQRKADEYQFTWDGCNNLGIKMPSGIYLLSLSNDIEIQTKKIVLIK
ncbi:MAG: T9SS type A sorting domain-containing protein, partial [Candidatus Marinimicrobia bacterium]|nr:T9SS type A sorting domain-containing protein [Candidatus Neomarinimicrobiota bacterium]